MSLTNLERVERALDALDRALRPWLARTLADPALPPAPEALLGHALERWAGPLDGVLGAAGRRIVADLRDARIRHAAADRFDGDQTYRVLDDCARLLSAVSARAEETEVEQLRQDALRTRFDEETRKEARRAASVRLEGTPQEGLRPWREVVSPHPDVARGTYQVAEFAADLWQVYSGNASDEYMLPEEFFRRTYLTEGLKQLLVGALRRLGGANADPVIELQTNFGGGKTHSMLALYHLFSGVAPGRLAGLEELLGEADVPHAGAVQRAVLVGNRLSPGQPERKADGTVVRTLWGELAWQLGGAEGFALVAEADATSTNPGDALQRVFARFAPCLILVDEWVAYARQLRNDATLPGGTFETHFTFAQLLSEAAKAAPRTLLVVSIPASESPDKKGGTREAGVHDIEVGGELGAQALARLKNAIGRVESPWRPASPEESFEIVRRRLFEPPRDTTRYAARDAVVRAFMDLYRAHPNDFPPACQERAYERRLQAAYPIHPELFDRLYDDWSALPRFQRTRGVLRLMATVIHALYHKDDRALMILPSSLPMDDATVLSELTRYLDDNWAPIVSHDVDGPNSRPLALDKQHVGLGKVSATRRVARTVFLGSAPGAGASHRGLEERSVKLGCAQPGEVPAPFGDALRRLSDSATYLYVDGTRHWYDTKASVARLAEDRAHELEKTPDVIEQHLVERLQAHFKDPRARGDFLRVHVCPRRSEDVPDEREARLVVLDPLDVHLPRLDDSAARKRAQGLLEEHGSGRRKYRNAIVFLAPDKRRMEELASAARTYLAWRSIVAEKDPLDLSPFQVKQAESKLKSADETVSLRIPETWCVLLTPEQDRGERGKPPPPMEWAEVRLQGPDPLGVRASKKLRTEGKLTATLGGTVLRKHLDDVPLWRGDHVALKTLADDFATYLYLPRLRVSEVLSEAVQNGLANTAWGVETFALAEGFEESAKRYPGLVAGRGVAQVPLDGTLVLVRPEVAQRQFAEDERAAAAGASGAFVSGPAVPYGGPAGGAPGTPIAPRPEGVAPTPQVLRRFHASVDLDALALAARAQVLVDEVLRHLTALPQARVRVTLEIDALAPRGMPENVVRTVGENCRTLGIRDPSFEPE